MIVEAARPGPDDTVLDVACGGGIVVCAFAPHVRAGDRHRRDPGNARAGARRLAAEKGLTNVAWRQGDVNSLPYDDGSFTIVVTRFSLPPLSRPGRGACGKWSASARPGDASSSSTCMRREDPAKAAEFNRLEKLRDPSHARSPDLDRAEGPVRQGRTSGAARRASTSCADEVRNLLARSFPEPGRRRQNHRDVQSFRRG